MTISATQLPSTAECLYVYGLVENAGPSTGHDADLRRTAFGGVAAVHTLINAAELDDVDADLDEGSRLAALVRRHDAVVHALHAAGPVLPMRLGTLFPDEAALLALLQQSEVRVREALDRVRGRDQWELRIAAPDDADRADNGAPRSGTDYLMGRRAVRQEQARRAATVDDAIVTLDEQLAALATERAGAARVTSRFAVSRSYLVARDVQEPFLAAAEEGIAELERIGCPATLRGPLPPYTFVDVRLAGEAQ